MRDAYSPYKGLRHLDVIQAVRSGVPARPIHVQVILSDLCNQACHFCAYRDPTYTSSQLFRVLEPGSKGLRKPGYEGYNFNPNRMIPYAKVLEILEDCRAMGVEAIQYTGGVEPTVHPDFADIVYRTEGMAFSLVTNGVNVHRKKLAHGLAKASWVRVSLDAATVDTYARMRSVPPWQFADACAAIRSLRNERDKQGTKCVIGVGFVVNRDNYAEVYSAVSLAKSLGADNIRISAQFSAEDERLFEDFHGTTSSWAKAAEALTDETFTVFNRFGEKLDDLKQGAPDYETCGYQSFTTYIGADLNIYRCCVLAYNERGVVGSLKEQRFRDLWMSQQRADDMAKFNARACERCQFNNINRVLDYALRSDEPEHAEFV